MWLFTHQLLDGLVLAGVYALIAVSLTFIYAVSKQLQLAHGEVMILGAYAGYFTLLVVPNLFVALAVGLVLGALAGWAINDGIFRWLRGAGHLSIVAGLALSAVIEETLRLSINQGRPVTYPASVEGNGASNLFQLLILVLALALGAAFQWFLLRTKHGRALRATADNPEAARVARHLHRPHDPLELHHRLGDVRVRGRAADVDLSVRHAVSRRDRRADRGRDHPLRRPGEHPGGGRRLVRDGAEPNVHQHLRVVVVP